MSALLSADPSPLAQQRLASYANDPVWRAIRELLPDGIAFDDAAAPREDYFDWRSSRLHVDRFTNPAARWKLILHHGLGTNGRLLSLLLGRRLSAGACEVAALDLPPYGRSEWTGENLRYEDWVDAAASFAAAEMRRDRRPVVLFGFSAGGMLAYHVASVTEGIAGIVGMCFVDLRDPVVRDAVSAFSPMIDRIGRQLMRLAAASPLRGLRVPIHWVTRMAELVNSAAARRVLLADPHSGATPVSLEFLNSLYAYAPPVDPEHFDRCPVLLAQPAADTWTPLAVSRRFFDRLSVRKEVILLENAGHYPLELPGVRQLADAIERFVASV